MPKFALFSTLPSAEAVSTPAGKRVADNMKFMVSFEAKKHYYATSGREPERPAVPGRAELFFQGGRNDWKQSDHSVGKPRQTI
ncbi:hypothetical protein [Salidesulfovibrio brasiliensis]|uniref:hypothetical protein n=1 Tax=Salidesulfovibrio brasiliensis TaxID=221711 RepID=UPI0012ED7FC9|nr:hypothetical protein [Salidesulfovibrio brasiliensis]